MNAYGIQLFVRIVTRAGVSIVEMEKLRRLENCFSKHILLSKEKFKAITSQQKKLSRVELGELQKSHSIQIN